MAKPVMITADSTCDLSKELKQEFNIKTIPLTIVLGDESYIDGENFTPADIYKRYELDKTLPKTAAPGVQDFLDFFQAFVNEGYEVVHLDISSELSNSFNAARLAAQEFEGVYTVDSRMLSTGVGLLAIEGAELRDKGMCAKDIAQRLEGLTDKVDTSFVLDTLQFMWKGGRCTGVAALGANLLHLKPALHMNEGKLEVYKKYRGSIEAVYKQYIRERLSGKNIRGGHVFITESGEVDESVIQALEQLIRECAPNVERVHHTLAGCTVSSHCGPKTLGVLFINE